MGFIKKNWPVLALITIGFFIFSFNLHNGLFWDDDDWILNNQFVHSISWSNVKFWFTHNTLAGVGLKSNYYRPFLFFTFAVNYVIADVKPFGYHLLSNLIHIGSGILIFYILSIFFKRRTVPFLTALFFLIHPLQTEAVTYIAGRGDPLYVFFLLLALWSFIKAEAGGRKLTYRLLSVGSLVLALLSREVAIIFPLLLVSFYLAFFRKTTFWRSLLRGTVISAPYFAVVVFYGILRLTALNFLNTLNFYSVHNVYADHLYVRLFTFLKVLTVYLGLLFVPVGLHMDRSMEPQLSLWKWPVWAVFLGLTTLVVWLMFLYKKEQAARSKPQDSHPSSFSVWFFGISWFFIGLAPVSGITPINALLYEHWLYLPTIGFFFIVSFYLDKLLNFLKENKKPVLFGLVVSLLCVYFVFLGVQSVRRNVLWGKPLNFYLDILKYESDSVRVNNNVGNLYFYQGDTDKAQEFYQKAVDSEDIFPQPHFNLGSILQSKGDIYGAIQEYEKAVKLDPNFYYPYPNLVSIYARQGNLEKASAYITKLDELRPNDPRILYNVALIYAAQGNFVLALQKAKQGLVYTGTDAEVRKALEEIIDRLTK